MNVAGKLAGRSIAEAIIDEPGPDTDRFVTYEGVTCDVLIEGRPGRDYARSLVGATTWKGALIERQIEAANKRARKGARRLREAGK